jgi:hypothetical protein
MSHTHTPEPWSIEQHSPAGLCHIVRHSGATTHIAEVVVKANARRIVACVNACAGIPDDMVSHVVAFGLQGHNKVSEDNSTLRDALQTQAEEAAKLIEQRDGLVDALQSAINQVEYMHRKFAETGSGNGFIAQWQHLITNATLNNKGNTA